MRFGLASLLAIGLGATLLAEVVPDSARPHNISICARAGDPCLYGLKEASGPGRLVGDWSLKDAYGHVLLLDLLKEIGTRTGLPAADIVGLKVAKGQLRLKGQEELVLVVSFEGKTSTASPYPPPIVRALRYDLLGQCTATRVIEPEGYGVWELNVFKVKGLPHPLVGFVDDMAGSADFYHWVLWDWSGPEPKQVFADAANRAWQDPNFVDLDRDGFDELLFENLHSKYDAPPQIYRWDKTKQTFSGAEAEFPGFWNERIAEEIKVLKAWEFPEPYKSPADRLPLTRVSRLAGYFKARQGKQGVEDFLYLADEKLELLIRNKKNDYVKGRALELKQQVHKGLDGSR